MDNILSIIITSNLMCDYWVTLIIFTIYIETKVDLDWNYYEWMSTCVCKEELGSVRRIFFQNIVIMEGKHVLLWEIEDGRAEKDWFVEEKRGFWHVDEGQILVDDSELLEVWFGD